MISYYLVCIVVAGAVGLVLGIRHGVATVEHETRDRQIQLDTANAQIARLRKQLADAERTANHHAARNNKH
jgi:hypothetical protein